MNVLLHICIALMPISDADYQTWLFADYKVRCVLVEAKAYSGGAEVTRYFSNKAFVSKPSDAPASTPYDDILVSIPTFKAQLSELFMGASIPSYGDLEVTNENGVRDSWLDDGWDGRAISLYLGDPGWARSDFRPVLSGVCADIYAPSRNRLALKLRDKTWMLNKAIQTALIGGTTANKNQPIPISLGQCFNVTPRLVTAATHEYQVHPGQIEDVPAVRDSGDPVAYVKDLANGKFTLNAAAVGEITCDVKGAKPGGTYHTKCADLVQYVLTTYTSLTADDIDAASFTAFNTTCPQLLGRYVGERENAIDVIDDLVTSVGGFYTFSRAGLLQLGRLEAPAGTAAIELLADDIAQGQIAVVRRDLPIATVRLGYQRNYTIQDGGRLAGVVTEANRALYGAPYQISSATDAGVFTAHKLAREPDVFDTCLVLQADADTEAARRQTLYGSVRSVTRGNGFMAPYKVALGQVAKLTHPRFGFAAGVKGITVAFSEQLTRNRVVVDLWK